MRRAVKRQKKSRRAVKESEVSTEESSSDKDEKHAKKNYKKKIKCLITLKQNQNNSDKYSINIFFREN